DGRRQLVDAVWRLCDRGEDGRIRLGVATAVAAFAAIAPFIVTADTIARTSVVVDRLVLRQGGGDEAGYRERVAQRRQRGDTARLGRLPGGGGGVGLAGAALDQAVRGEARLPRTVERLAGLLEVAL